MAEVDVKKQQGSEKGSSLQKNEGTGVSRRGWEGFPLSLWPSDFFGANPFSPNPFSMMRRFHDDMDRTFARVFRGEAEGGLGVWSPAIEVAEQNGQLKVRADLPGLKPEDVKVEVTDDAVIIQGERKNEHEETKGGVYRCERSYGHFHREIPVPEGAKSDQAKAQFKDGVLEVSIPIPEQAGKRRTIPVEAVSWEPPKTQK
jgi:HSP20 family protein